jgi:Uncharacterized protein conserved in bacteria (DUF2169)
VRADLLLGHDPTRLLPPEMDVPYDLDWSFFQAAPREQRIDHERLTGDEWLVLGGFFARRPRLRTALPGARGAARLYRRADPEPRAGEPFAMRLDMLHVDLDTFTCSLVWRGHLDAGDADPADLYVAAGIELPGQPLPWEDPFLRAPGRPSMPPERPSGPWEPSGEQLGETVMLPSEREP